MQNYVKNLGRHTHFAEVEMTIKAFKK